MKLPISFGSRFFYRVVFPGAVITSALSRPTYSILLAHDFTQHFALVFIIQIFILGWMFLTLDMPIYIALEGRRYWPRWLLTWGRSRERKRLIKLHKTMRRLSPNKPASKNSGGTLNNRQAYLEAAVEISRFPLSENTGRPLAEWPTRLGNLIASYEQYPNIKFGLDAIFFWPRIWISIDKELRSEIDEQQAQVDGLLYLSVSLFISSIIFLLYLAIDLFWPSVMVFNTGPSANIIGWISTTLLSFIIYRISMFQHAQFGETFKAVFDQHRDLIKVQSTVRLVAEITDDYGLFQRSERAKNTAVWRYLKWHRTRLANQNSNRRVLRP